MSLSWDLIRTFEVVADTGSLSAAARRLGLTQPTAGRHIDLLEDSLNMQLFVRSRDGMQLTEQGGNLIDSAIELSSAAAGFERRAAGIDDQETGVVRISANEIFGVLVLPGLLDRFLNVNPGIQIELVVSNSASNLLKRDADVAIRMFRPTQNDLVARRLAELPLGLFAHQDYLSRFPAPRELADLKQHRFIGFDREQSLIEVARQLGLDLTPDDFVFRSDNILTHIEAIRNGVGIGVTHRGLAAKWADVKPVLPDLNLPALDLWIACHSDVRYNRRIRLVMDFLAEELRVPYR